MNVRPSDATEELPDIEDSNTEEDKSTKLEQELAALLTKLSKKQDVGMNFPLLSDLSDRLPDGVDVLRVDLRRCKEYKDPRNPTKRAVEKAAIIGTLPESDLPEEGEVFQMFYHSYDGILRFGHLTTDTPISDVHKDGKNYFFTIDGVDWRLSIIDVGN